MGPTSGDHSSHAIMKNFGILFFVGALHLSVIETRIRNELDPNCNCDTYLFDHYDTKRCTPVFKEGCDCPIRFECPEISERSKEDCYLNGKTYAIGEEADCGHPCYQCRCRNESYGAAIDYKQIHCPLERVDAERARRNCYYPYKFGECCPRGEVCDTYPLECKFRGKAYRMGEFVPTDDPCVSCLCSMDWLRMGPVGNCQRWGCKLDEYLELMIQGAVPIYFQDDCCPDKFHKITGEEDIIHFASNNTDPNMQCVFNKKRGNIGDVLKLPNEECTTCTCRTPPDFSCTKPYRC